jgi:transposase
VTLQLLHAEYVDEVGVQAAYSYSLFCELFRQHERATMSPTMRQRHVAGEKTFLDWAGMTMPIIDRVTGEVIDAQIFLGTLGESSFTHARAYRSRRQRDCLMAHSHLFERLGGVPQIVVPDNTKTGVTHPHRYDPDVNLAYADLAWHEGCVACSDGCRRLRRPGDVDRRGRGVLVHLAVLARPEKRRTAFAVA